MKALVVYESIYGNTQAIAAAIGAGLRTRAGAEVEVVEVGSAPDAEPYDLVVVGGPIHAWGMSSAMTRDGAAEEARRAHKEPVSTSIGVREWLARLAPVSGEHLGAAFDTRMSSRWFPLGSAAKGESRELARTGYRLLADPEHFLVEGKEGPLKEGEVERALAWGVTLGEAADR